MVTVKELIEYYSELVAILKQERIQQAILFKGFVDMEEKNLTLFLQYADDDAEASLTRRTKVSHELKQLLGCEIGTTDAAHMRSDYAVKLDDTNSVQLLKSGVQCDDAQQNLARVFGSAWEFNDVLRLAAEPSMAGYEEYVAEMERVRGLLEEGEREPIPEGDELRSPAFGGVFSRAGSCKREIPRQDLNFRVATRDGIVLVDFMLSLDPEAMRPDRLQEAIKFAVGQVASTARTGNWDDESMPGW